MYNNVMPLLIHPSSWPQALLAVVTWTLSGDGCPAWLPCLPLKQGTNEEFVTGQRAEHLRGLALTSSLAHTHLYTEGWSQGQAVSQWITPEIWSTLVFVWAGSHTGAVSIFQTSLGSARHSDQDHPLDLWVLQLEYFLEHVMKFMSRLIKNSLKKSFFKPPAHVHSGLFCPPCQRVWCHYKVNIFRHKINFIQMWQIFFHLDMQYEVINKI